MLRTKLDLEVQNYFFDNGDLTFDLQVAIHDLIFTNGKPTQGELINFPNNLSVWRVMNHAVVYQIKDEIIAVWAVKPLS